MKYLVLAVTALLLNSCNLNATTEEKVTFLKSKFPKAFAVDPALASKDDCMFIVVDSSKNVYSVDCRYRNGEFEIYSTQTIYKP